jgi:hypothetical protein
MKPDPFSLPFPSFGLLWKRYRRPDWADTPGNIVVPGGGWILVFILVLVFVLLAFAITKDPLAPH